MNEFWDYITTADNWWGETGLAMAIYDHLRISGFAVLLAILIGMPPALLLGHLRRGGLLAISVLNIGRAVPTFAIIALAFPISLEYGLGFGFWPTAVALVLLAIPPIFTNTYTGVRGVDPGVVESAVGMGMGPRQVLLRVEVPSAMPLIITGIRVSAVQVIATATLGALFGFGGLGRQIVEGKAQQDDGKLLTGAVLVALLAIITEIGFSMAERALTPWAERRRRRRNREPVDATPAFV